MISILIISLVFFARKQIAVYSLNNYLLAHSAQLNCIDFNLTSSLNIFVSKACLNTPQADIELTNANIQLSSTFQVSAINVEAMTINAKAKLLAKADAEQSPIEGDNLEHYLSKIAQFSLPLPIAIQSFTYLPFSQLNNPQKTVIYGQLDANESTINLALKDSEQRNIIAAELIPNGDSFTAKLNTDLSQLVPLLASHQLALPAKWSKSITLAGKFTTQLQWHEKTLTANSQLSHFSIDSAKGVEQSGPFNINGMLSWQTSLTANKALFTIDEQSLINTHFSDEKLLEFLTTKNTAADLISLIKDNPTNGVLITPKASIEIDFAKQQAFISRLKLASKNADKPLQLTLTDAAFGYQTEGALLPSLTYANYALNARLAVSKLNSLTKSHAKLAAVGTIKQNNTGWIIAFSPTTSLELSVLKFSPKSQNSAKTNSTAHTINKKIVSIEKFITHWQGSIDVDQHGLAEISLQLDSQASMLQAANIALIEQLEVKADITGELQNIIITASTIADKQLLANIRLTGAITQPQFDIFTDDLALTELLTLKLNLPVDISLIDGSASYRLLGQLTDTNNWLNNTATLNASIQDVSGEIDGTWIQELNWQQAFVLSNGDLKTVNADDKPKKNLTIAKIETAPPLTEFSAQTDMSFKNKELTVKLTGIETKLLGGSINIANAQWPLLASRSVDVQLTSIDLENLLALDPKQGIIVTGKISGNLPVSTDGKQFTILAGELHNITDGIIKVANNPAVEELKKSDPQLKLAFDAMQNIHYHQLSSDVSMANDGYMLFDTMIKGRNPDLDNDVNLNLNLSYDLLGLLESLNITKDLEQTLIDKLQKN
ncbi:MAG: YdbH domain-containing protein [Colwellia sp.]|nr:YdbH domain-containing protein [Colwellia sp.]